MKVVQVGIFERYYGGLREDGGSLQGNVLLPSASGGAIVISSTTSLEVSALVDNDGDDWIFKVDDTGEIVWQYVANAKGPARRFSDAIEVLDGALFAVGYDREQNKGIILKL